MRRSETTSSTSRLKQAAHAEEMVAHALRKQGWSILYRNFRHIGCELDIVAIKMRTLIAVEVKLRSRKPNHLQEMIELLPVRKRQALLRGAELAAARSGGQYETIRIDLALVYPDHQKSLKIDYFVSVLS